MSKLIPLTLEPEEPLKENEEFVGVKTIRIDEGGGYVAVGYVALIRNTHDRFDYRYGSLKAVKYENMKINDKVL